MVREGIFERRALIVWAAFLVAAVTGITFASFGTGEDGIRQMVRNTARLSLAVLFWPFIASSVAELRRGPAGKWLMRNRRYLGLCFSVTHGAHAIFIALFGVLHTETFRDNVGPFGVIGGGTAYLFLIAMTITSFDGPAARLGRRRWRILHKLGMYAFWGIFALSYLGRVAAGDPRFAPAAALVVLGVGLRTAAWQHRRSRLREKRQRRAAAS